MTLKARVSRLEEAAMPPPSQRWKRRSRPQFGSRNRPPDTRKNSAPATTTSSGAGEEAQCHLWKRVEAACGPSGERCAAPSASGTEWRPQ